MCTYTYATQKIFKKSEECQNPSPSFVLDKLEPKKLNALNERKYSIEYFGN